MKTKTTALALWLGLVCAGGALMLCAGCSGGTDAGGDALATGSPHGDAAEEVIPSGMARVCLNIRWPSAEADAKVIPTGSHHLEFTITPEGAEEPEVSDSIQRSDVVDGTVSRKYMILPGDNKVFEMKAVDSQDQIVAQAQVVADVPAGQNTQVGMVLESTGILNPVVSGTATPPHVLEAEAVTLTGTATDPDGVLALLEWDETDDGTYDYSTTDVSTGDYAVVIHPATAGVFQARFRATDNDGLTSDVPVQYQCGATPPEWVSVPTAADVPRRYNSDQLTLTYTAGFPETPCAVEASGGTIAWLDESGSAPEGTFLGRFYSTDSAYLGTTPVTMTLRDGLDRTDTATVSVTVQEGFHGFVTDLFSAATVSGLTVTVSGQQAVTFADGEYVIHGLGSGTPRMDVTGGIVTRSFEVQCTATGHQDVTVLPATYNTVFLRALLYGPRGARYEEPGVTRRWRPPPASPPTFVIYRYWLDDGEDPREISAADRAAMIDIIENELPVISDGFFGGPGSWEDFDGAPEDDPRATIYTTGDPTFPWCVLDGYNAIALSVVEAFDNPDAAGVGGIRYDDAYWATGGGATVMANRDYRYGLIRHELGHALGFAHPFEHVPLDDPDLWPQYMELSVMNYASTGYDSDTYTVADTETMDFQYHRAPFNNQPDSDPDGMVGYRSSAETYGIVWIDLDLDTTPWRDVPRPREYVVRNGRTIWLN